MQKKATRIMVSAKMMISTQLAYAKDGKITVIRMNKIRIRKMAWPYNQIILRGDDASSIRNIVLSIAGVIRAKHPELRETKKLIGFAILQK